MTRFTTPGAGLLSLSLFSIGAALAQPAPTAAPPVHVDISQAPATTPGHAADDDATEIAKKLQNPVGDLISVPLTNSQVRGLLGIWVSGGEAEGLHFVGVLSFGDEFREDGALGYIQEKFGEALA